MISTRDFSFFQDMFPELVTKFVIDRGKAILEGSSNPENLSSGFLCASSITTCKVRIRLYHRVVAIHLPEQHRRWNNCIGAPFGAPHKTGSSKENVSMKRFAYGWPGYNPMVTRCLPYFSGAFSPCVVLLSIVSPSRGFEALWFHLEVKVSSSFLLVRPMGCILSIVWNKTGNLFWDRRLAQKCLGSRFAAQFLSAITPVKSYCSCEP